MSTTADPRHPTGPSHRDLLDAVRHLRELARSGDAAGMVPALIDLRDDVVHHVEAEADDLAHLPGATPELARHGQAELVGLVDRLLAGAGHHDGVDCLVGAVEIERRLRRQAQLESVLRRHLAT